MNARREVRIRSVSQPYSGDPCLQRTRTHSHIQTNLESAEDLTLGGNEVVGSLVICICQLYLEINARVKKKLKATIMSPNEIGRAHV